MKEHNWEKRPTTETKERAKKSGKTVENRGSGEDEDDVTYVDEEEDYDDEENGGSVEYV